MARKPRCLHCGQPCRARRRRGLCRCCYDDAGVRRRYPCLGPLAGRRRRDPPAVESPRPPPAPTAAEPGSPRKIAALIERARRRLALFHEADPRLVGPVAGDGARRRLRQLERLAASTLDRPVVELR
jgi:hypothetical protein